MRKKTTGSQIKNFVLIIIIIAAFLSSALLLYKSGIWANSGTNEQIIKENTIDNTTLPEKTAAANQPADIIKKPSPPLAIDPLSLPSKFNYQWQVLKDGKPVTDYKTSENILFPDSSKYNKIDGVTCFRGNNFRDSASFGYVDVKTAKLKAVWSKKIGYIDIWTGVGWNGQPSIIKWDENLKQKMNIYDQKKKKIGLKEVIYATLDGKIYFIDLDDGKATRPEINIGYPHKGSVSIDPRGYPLLYAGQGIPEVGGKPVPIGYRIYSLIDQQRLLFINGIDKDAYRGWGAFDSGGLLDPSTDTLYVCGENGILYNIKLNTAFDADKGKISIMPDITKYRYTSPFGSKIGTENSPVIYKNYIIFADNSGLLQCVDLNTLKPVWLRNITDDTDSTMVLESVNESEAFIYTACEVDRQGVDGYSYIRKINALTGKLVWEKAIKAAYDPNNNGGALASPVLGKHDINNLLIYNIAKSGMKKNGSTLIALDRKTGNEVWKVYLDHYSWSSPVDVYTKEGKSYILICDSAGYMRLLEGSTGKELDKIALGANIEGSPAVYDNMIVVGTRGQKIWGIKIE